MRFEINSFKELKKAISIADDGDRISLILADSTKLASARVSVVFRITEDKLLFLEMTQQD